MTLFDIVVMAIFFIVGACLSVVVTIINHRVDSEKVDTELERYYDQLNRKAEYEGLPDAPGSDVIDVTNYAEEVTK